MINSANTFNVFKISSIPFRPDVISGLLWELEITGITEEDDFIMVFTADESPVSEKRINELLQKLVSEGVIESFSVKKEILENKNWNELWEKSREVLHVSNRIVIKPTFKEYNPGKDEIVLTIDPKMSFGTGEHQSTKLVLQLLEKYVKPGMTVLDVGSGTGILAITAIKFGAKYAVAVDNDEWCYKNCIENCELNLVSDKVKVVNGEITDVSANNFDLILANIQRDVLMEIAVSIKEKLSGKGIVILSGLLAKDKGEIIKHYSRLDFSPLESKVMNDWISLALMVCR